MAISLVAIVSAVALPRFINFGTDARTSVTNQRLSSLRAAITGDASRNQAGYISHMGALPATLADLTTKGTKPDYNPINKTGWNGPYIDGNVNGWNLDSWGTAYQYSTATRTIRSCGANATCGDGDDITVTF